MLQSEMIYRTECTYQSPSQQNHVSLSDIKLGHMIGHCEVPM